MTKKLVAVALTLSLAACSGEKTESSVHAAEGAQAKDASSVLDKAGELGSQASTVEAQKLFEEQLAAVGAQVETLKKEAAQAAGDAKVSAGQLADKLGQRYAEAQKRYQAWKAEGGKDLKKLGGELQPLLAEVREDLDAALEQLQGE